MARVLVIDDDAAMRRMMARVLSGAGHQVREAADGDEGLAAFAAEGADLVVCDLVMPDREGIETIRELRRAAPQLPILAVSGGGFPSVYLQSAVRLGASAALVKPFRAAELLDAVARLLG
jgi:CheY-like chemotaxis protein